MAEHKIPEILPDLPEDWGYGQIVSPEGVEAGLTERHGYNYLMRKVNAAVRAINEIIAEMGQITPADMVTAQGGGELLLPAILGGGPYEIMFTEEEADEYALKADLTKLRADLSKYALLLNPTFSKNLLVGYGAFKYGEELGEHLTAAIIAGYENFSSASYSITVGSRNRNTSDSNIVVGDRNIAYNANACCIGSDTESCGNYSIATGYGTIAKYLEFVAGKYNIASTVYSFYDGNFFIIGNGDSDTARSNAFRVAKDGSTFGVGSFHSSGADYAEIYEWQDGNPEAEDRVGRFVVLDGEHIRLAGPEDSPLDILGVVSARPSIVGDSYDDQWRGMYLRDVFGRLLYEDAEAEDPEHPGQTVPERRRKLNPAYDPARAYIPQSKRPEKAAVGLLGKLVLIDDGASQVNGWCKAGEGGVAIRSEERTRFRVMSRLDPTHIRITIMPQ